MNIWKDRYIQRCLLVIIGGVLLISLKGLLSHPEVTIPEKLPPPPEEYHRVKSVIDGDTLILDNGETLRLIGVDTPELHHSEVPVQRFAEEAKEFVEQTVGGMEVRLEYDEELHDSYGRLLAYIYLKDGRCLNREIIRRGYGYAYTRFPFKYAEDFREAEREARGRQYGLWNYSLIDGRITNLTQRYEQLNNEEKLKLDAYLDEILMRKEESDER